RPLRVPERGPRPPARAADRDAGTGRGPRRALARPGRARRDRGDPRRLRAPLQPRPDPRRRHARRHGLRHQAARPRGPGRHGPARGRLRLRVGRPRARGAVPVRPRLRLLLAGGPAAAVVVPGGFAGQVGSVLVMLPPGEPLAALYADRYPRRLTGLQVRVVDLPLALAGLRARTEAEFVLALRDPDCPWQDGAFRVRLGPDGCEARPLAGAADPDVSLGPLGLAAVLFGAQDPASTLATGTAEGDLGALEALAGVLAGHPVYMPRADHF